MNATNNNTYRRSNTRFSDDGCTAFVRLRVDRRSYEFARSWAQFHAKADPGGSAEEQLEGYLNMALTSHMLDLDWTAPPEIEALYPDVDDDDLSDGDMKGGFPF